ncbi:MAG: aminopeptidase [Treponema sp.]|nr:aminopeptidase [Treponema sp.]
MKRVFWVLPVFLFLAVLVMIFSGCYTIKQGTALLTYLGRAVPLEELAGESGGGEAQKNREFAERVFDIRRFAMEELGLKESKNYTNYVPIDRDYLAVVVSACDADSFTTHIWKYPVVGALPYKGFFDSAGARKEAARLDKKGLDVWVRGVDAFSTLGWFKDPLYSYMRDYPVHRLADLIIHELLHSTVFIKNQAAFNEQLAEYVGTEGAKRYIESRFGPESPEYRSILSSKHDAEAFSAFLRLLSADLDAVYQNPALDHDAKLGEKARIINDAKLRFDAEYTSRFTGDNYRFFTSLEINNAYLDLYRLYEADTFFADLALESAASLDRMISAAKKIAPKSTNPRQELKTLLAG